jgi:glycosyltransferase 2 family protein
MQLQVSRRHLSGILRVAVSVALVCGLVYIAGTADTLAQLKLVRWQVVALVAVILSSNVLVVAPRWALILTALGSPIRSATLIRSVFLGFLFNQLLPTAVGGDALRVWDARKRGAPLDIAIHSVLLDRVSGIVVVLIGTIALLPFSHLPKLSDGLWWLAALGIAGGLVGLASLWAIGRMPRIHVPVIGKLQRLLIDLSGSVSALLRHPTEALGVLAYAAGGQMIVVAAIYLLANEVGVHLPLVDVTLVAFGAMLASAVPISVAGWGVREGALIVLLGAYGVPADRTFTISVLFGACMVVASLPGAFALNSRYPGLAPPTPGKAE